MPKFILVLVQEQCHAWVLFKYKIIKTTTDGFTHNIIISIINTSKLMSIKTTGLIVIFKTH